MTHKLTPFFTSFKTHWKLLLILSIPAVLLGIFGLHQLDRLTVANAVSLTLVKGLCEFCFLGFGLAVLNLLRIKNKWVLSVTGFVYYFMMTADFVLLVYFRERFGAKYLDTVQGGDYNFMTDWRLLTYFVLVFLFCAFVFRRFFTPTPAKETLRRAAVCLAGFLLLMTWTPLKLLPAPDDFYTTYLLPPSLVYTWQTVRAKTPPALFSLDEHTAALANKYNLFSAKNTGVGKEYTRVILIAVESFSNKYMHHFNPNIPVQASAPLDKLYEENPSASLKHVSLSTLYGLSVIFTSHPFVREVVENEYPVSFVRMLKERGFHTAFLRGANETYMSENVLFKQAGFDSVIGATYFQTRDDYKKYLNWWGLLDRKLFDFTLEYLENHKNEPTFVTVLTVDSHAPLGRLDYLDEKYTEIDHKDYQMPTLPRAFARFGQDTERFLNGLKERGLWDDKTLVLITPDHPSYSNMPTVDLFTPFKPEFDNLPFIIVTKNKISTPITNNPLASQLDIAPTVLDLLNIRPPRAFFGHSLFDTNARRSVFDIKEDYAVITTQEGKQVVPLSSSRQADKPLLDLMRTIDLK